MAPRPPGYSVKTVTLVAIVFILGYVLLYGYLAGYALFVPGTPLIIRIAVVLSAFTLELVSASVSFALEFGRRRNPEMIREYLAKITQILSTNKANS